MGQQATSTAKIARQERRWLKRQPPMRVVPSRRGLAVTFAGVALLGYATGLGAWWLYAHTHPEPTTTHEGGRKMLTAILLKALYVAGGAVLGWFGKKVHVAPLVAAAKEIQRRS